ncbi:MAG: FAD:protein FMN transferase [Clostridia bacterium]|nr:FAD:protein FMN transferase [Clostridia bacterium]
MKKSIQILLIVVLVPILSVFCCCSPSLPLSVQAYVFGTYLDIMLYDCDDLEDITQTAFGLEAKLSADSAAFPESDIARYNKALSGESVEVDEVTYNLVVLCKQLFSCTNGAFNPCMYWLTEYWDFLPYESDYAISYKDDLTSDISNQSLLRARSGFDGLCSSSIDTARIGTLCSDGWSYVYDDAVNSDGFCISNSKNVIFGDKVCQSVTALKKISSADLVEAYQSDGKYYLKKSGEGVEFNGAVLYNRLELGAIAKGYALDVIKEMLTDTAKGYLSLGGSSIIALEPPKSVDSFNIGLINPRKELVDGAYYAKFGVSSACVSTSGDYERYFELGGERYCHIIGKDGFPIDNCNVMVTVVTQNAAEGDALTTALMVMGEGAIDYLDNRGLQYSLVRFNPSSGHYEITTNLELHDVNGFFVCN